MDRRELAELLAREEYSDPESQRYMTERYLELYDVPELELLAQAATEPDRRRALDLALQAEEMRQARLEASWPHQVRVSFVLDGNKGCAVLRAPSLAEDDVRGAMVAKYWEQPDWRGPFAITKIEEI